MKFKQDYRIHIAADTHGVCYWTATHKGEHKTRLSTEDYQTILAMLDEVRSNVSHAIDAAKSKEEGA